MKQFKNNADDHNWLAEFAVGYINDAIQKQHMDSKMCCVIVFSLFSAANGL